ncbi:MAG: hypothetical protein CSA07_00985 [Bacteroidia bacterium]|nr:MAG: hypothetical protein CSA07_00985 [Bacteroidia bacterium]
MGFRVFRTQRPRQFEYKPRYYSERKARLTAMEQRARQRHGLELEEETPTVREARLELERREHARSRRAAPQGGQLSRTLLILGILALALYLYIRL